MKKILKNPAFLIIAIILAVALLVGIVFMALELLKPKRTTTIGEIVYVYYNGNENEPFEDRAFVYHVYLKPMGNAENEDWILLTVLSETETESEKNTDVSKMPELAVGAIVEVVRNVDINKPNCDSDKYWIKGFFAESIKLVDNYSDDMDSEAVPLVANPKYEYNLKLKEDIKSGTLIGIIPINEPIKGYIVYIDPDGEDDVKKFWIDENTRLDFGEDMESIIKSGTTGIKVSATATTASPFKDANESVYTLHLIYKLPTE